MKSSILSFLIPLSLMIAGCSYIYETNLKPSDLSGGKLDSNKGYIYGVYDYVVRSPTYFANEAYLKFDLVPKSSNDKEIIISLNGDQGYFFVTMASGEYTLHKIILNFDGWDSYTVPVDQDFTVSPGTIFYLGNLKTEFRVNTLPYMWWGIESIGDQFQTDSANLMKYYSGITSADFFNGYSMLGYNIKPFEKRAIYIPSSQLPPNYVP